jgi:glycopeptide antibiotics resistance protein
VQEIFKLKYHKLNCRILKIPFSILYFSILTYIVFFARRRRHSYNHALNLVPFKVFTDFKNNSGAGIYNYYSNLIGNIILFLPYPIVLILAFKIHKISTILLLTITLSFSIELLQFIFKVGVADIDDIILNTIGACAGYACYLLYGKWFKINP